MYCKELVLKQYGINNGKSKVKWSGIGTKKIKSNEIKKNEFNVLRMSSEENGDGTEWTGIYVEQWKMNRTT